VQHVGGSAHVAVGIEVKQIPEATKSWVLSFGIIDGGLELMRQAWPASEHKFSIRPNDIALSNDGDLPGPTIL
jgi:hypothetical protein